MSEITLALNAINQQHSQLGGDAGFLGRSTGELQSCTDGIGSLFITKILDETGWPDLLAAL